jgi:hypothetical protein
MSKRAGCNRSVYTAKGAATMSTSVYLEFEVFAAAVVLSSATRSIGLAAAQRPAHASLQQQLHHAHRKITLQTEPHKLRVSPPELSDAPPMYTASASIT